MNTRLLSPRTELALVGLEVEELAQHGTTPLFGRVICGWPAVSPLDTLVHRWPPLALPPAPFDEEGSVCRAVMLPLALVMAKVKLRGTSVRCILYLNRDILKDLTYCMSRK